METLSLLLLTAGLVVAVSPLEQNSARIINGKPSVYGRRPYICSMKYYIGGEWVHECGAVIYNIKTLITAAHCVDGKQAKDIRVVCGEYDTTKKDKFEQTKDVKQFIMHKDYVHDYDRLLPNDIALLELTCPLTFNSGVNDVLIAKNDTFLLRNCLLMGWGRYGDAKDTSTILREVTSRRLENSVCQKMYGKQVVSDAHICFQDKGLPDSACHGDSGGPAVCGRFVVGVSSSVRVDGLNRCITVLPNVYTRISAYLGWIEANSFK